MQKDGPATDIALVKPSAEHLPSYLAELKRGMTKDHTPQMLSREIAQVEKDPVRFLQEIADREKPRPVTMADSSS